MRYVLSFPSPFPLPSSARHSNSLLKLRERSAQENKPTSAIVTPPSQPEQAPEVPRVIAPPTAKQIKKKVEGGENKAFKLRGREATDESILRSPLCRASASKLHHSTKRSSSPFHNSDDKENPTT